MASSLIGGIASAVGSDVVSSVVSSSISPSVPSTPSQPTTSRFANWSHKTLIGITIISAITTIASIIFASYQTAVFAGILTLTGSLGSYYFKPGQSLEKSANNIRQLDRQISVLANTEKQNLAQLNAADGQLNRTLNQAKQDVGKALSTLGSETDKLNGAAAAIEGAKPLVRQLSDATAASEREAANLARQTTDLRAATTDLSAAATAIGQDNALLAKEKDQIATATAAASAAKQELSQLGTTLAANLQATKAEEDRLNLERQQFAQTLQSHAQLDTQVNSAIADAQASLAREQTAAPLPTATQRELARTHALMEALRRKRHASQMQTKP